ncbi:MAG: ATP-binding protein, partial [Pseudomonadota bacterium]
MCDGYVLGLSGGVDSTALLALVKEASGVLDFQILVAHCYHGEIEGDEVQSAYRKRALQHCSDLAGRLGVDMRCNLDDPESSSPQVSQSEAALRSLRYRFFESLRRSQTGTWGLITAHHRDDVLET